MNVEQTKAWCVRARDFLFRAALILFGLTMVSTVLGNVLLFTLSPRTQERIDPFLMVLVLGIPLLWLASLFAYLAIILVFFQRFRFSLRSLMIVVLTGGTCVTLFMQKGGACPAIGALLAIMLVIYILGGIASYDRDDHRIAGK